MKHLIKSCIAAASALVFGATAQAALTIDVLEVGGDVVLEVFGTLDTTGLTSFGDDGTGGAGIDASEGFISIIDGVQVVTFFELPEPLPAFGSSGFIAGIASGDPFALSSTSLALAPEPVDDFMPGDVVNSVLTFTNLTIALMGLDEGTTVLMLPNDTIT
ncbi:MAG: hypothetical protein HRU11_10410, partial [Parvularculaceae bacterium]|nr:hypothetical protein [Parvularculaceae bacterium]